MEEFRGVDKGQLLVLYFWGASVTLRLLPGPIREYAYDGHHILR